MIYTTTSIDEVIARVIRNTHVSESTYITSMIEWIPEAMGMMRTKMSQQPAWSDVRIEFHLGKMPCGLIDIKAVEWRGIRLRYGNSVRSITAPTPKIPPKFLEVDNPTAFKTVPIAIETPTGTVDNPNYRYDSDLKQLRCNNISDALGLSCGTAWYSTQLDYLQTSFADGCVRLHYSKLPVDEDGLPLIPDNEFYKEALYWYSRSKMIGAGWKDEQFAADYCDQKFEVSAARAMGEIKYPAVDQMEMKVNALTRFIPPADYFDRFFSTPNGEGNFGINVEPLLF